MNNDIEKEKLRKALLIATQCLEWYAEIGNYDENGRAEEVHPGTKAGSALSKIYFILKGIKLIIPR